MFTSYKSVSTGTYFAYRQCTSQSNSSSSRNFVVLHFLLSTITSSHPEETKRTCNSSTKSCARRTILIPLPPPPSEALTRTGHPILSASFFNTTGSWLSPLNPGISGTVFAFLVKYSFADLLSPKTEIDSGEGPIQINPASITAFANPSFSDK